MSQIVLGKAGTHNVSIDIPLLLTTRLLVQANSGGGKSWLLRRLAEQLYGKVQTIILDPEGEFFTLRDKFGYVLVGEGGETPADVRSAELLAQKFMELKVSAVCDLYETFRSRPNERRQWVRLFLNALLEVPRSLWRPLVVIVDEAHKFCPQETPKAGDQREREIIAGCKDAMIAFATTGRKRGFCAVWATQRLAKVDKDASAELFNRLVGMTIEDVDVDRAADLMSVSKEDKPAFRTSLRTLEPGEFYAFGRAISKVRVLLKTGSIQTRHPESGAAAKHSEPPPMPDAVAKLLPKLADLPKEAEEKARTEAEFKREIRELKGKLSAASRQPAAKPVASAANPQAIERAVSAAVKQRDIEWAKSTRGQEGTLAGLRAGLGAALEDAMKVVARVTAFGFEQTKVNPKQLEAAVQKAVEEVGRQITLAGDIRRKEFDLLRRDAEALLVRMQRVLDKKLEVKVDVVRAQPPFVLGPAPSNVKQSSPASPEIKQRSQAAAGVPREPAESDGELKGPEKRILRALGELRSIGKDSPTREMVAAWATYSVNSTTYTNPLGALRTRGHLTYPQPGLVALTESGLVLAGDCEAPDNDELWRRIDGVCKGPERKIMHALYDHGEAMTREDLATATNYSVASTTFTNPLGALRSAGLIEYPQPGMAKAAEWLLERKTNGVAA